MTKSKRTKGCGKKFKTMPVHMRGGAWYDDLWSGVKSVAGPIIDVAKKTGAISKLASAFGQPEIAAVAGSLGFGRKRKRGMKGGSNIINA